MGPDRSYGLLQLYGELAKHSLTQEQACLLRGSGSRGAKATRRQELSRALKLERAGLPVDAHSGLHQQSSGSRAPSPDAVVCRPTPPGEGISHQSQLQLAGPSGDETAATMRLGQEDLVPEDSNDSDASETSAADSAMEPSPSKRQKLGEGSTPSSGTAERSLAAGAAASGLADVRTALKQSRAELGLPGEGNFFVLPDTVAKVCDAFSLFSLCL